jgi:hypothetical protein
MTRPGETPAADATIRTVVSATPASAMHSMAASRIRAFVVRSSDPAFVVERMFSILYVCSRRCRRIAAVNTALRRPPSRAPAQRSAAAGVAETARRPASAGSLHTDGAARWGFGGLRTGYGAAGADRGGTMGEDPRSLSSGYREELEALTRRLRDGITRVDDAPRAMALFETAAEVLTGLGTAFQHYEQESEGAWRAS